MPTCPRCQNVLPEPPERFCASCGTPVPESTRQGDGKQGEDEQTMYKQAERSGDPWEG